MCVAAQPDVWPARSSSRFGNSATSPRRSLGTSPIGMQKGGQQHPLGSASLFPPAYKLIAMPFSKPSSWVPRVLVAVVIPLALVLLARLTVPDIDTWSRSRVVSYDAQDVAKCVEQALPRLPGASMRLEMNNSSFVVLSNTGLPYGTVLVRSTELPKQARITIIGRAHSLFSWGPPSNVDHVLEKVADAITASCGG